MADDVCSVCGLTYAELRTGLTYADVYALLWSASDDRRTWRYKRRNTILGKWHEIKQELWAQHLDECYFYAGQYGIG